VTYKNSRCQNRLQKEKLQPKKGSRPLTTTTVTLYPMSTIYATSSHEDTAARFLDQFSRLTQEENTEETRLYSEVAKTPEPASFFSILTSASFYEPPDLPLDNGRPTESLVQYKTYPHPSLVKNWKKIWAAPPIVINRLNPCTPAIEDKFQSAMFRLYFSAEDIHCIYRQTPFVQGTTLIDRQSSPTYARFIVEGCQWVHNHQAYLKVVGITRFRTTLPYDHPVFPSFILVVPVCVSQVPIPDEIAPFIRDEEYSAVYKASEGRPTLCRVCQVIAEEP
jgi:hypothetical protein